MKQTRKDGPPKGVLGIKGRPPAWKAFPWSAMDQLHEKGYISDPATKSKSVWLSEEGAKLSEEFCAKLLAVK
jgi:hypothetical protein